MPKLVVQNHGPLITACNYWTLPAAEAGKVYISINAGAFRVLLPRDAEPSLPDMLAARECLVTRAPWPAMRLADAFEFLFDDRTRDPFAFHTSPEALDRLPPDEDIAIPWILSVWTSPRRGRPHKALERPCWYRRGDALPYLKPRETP